MQISTANNTKCFKRQAQTSDLVFAKKQWKLQDLLNYSQEISFDVGELALQVLLCTKQ